jgi:hypothetical protein
MVNLNFMHILVSALSKEALETLVKEKGFQYTLKSNIILTPYWCNFSEQNKSGCNKIWNF